MWLAHDPGHGTNVVDVIEMGNSVPSVESHPTFLAFETSVLTTIPPTLPNITSLSTPTCLYDFLPGRSVQTTAVLTSYVFNNTIRVGFSGPIASI